MGALTVHPRIGKLELQTPGQQEIESLRLLQNALRSNTLVLLVPTPRMDLSCATALLDWVEIALK